MFQAADDRFFMTISHNIFNGFLPDYLTHAGLELTDRRQAQHIFIFLLMALGTMGLQAHVGQAGVGAIDQAEVSDHCVVPANPVIAQRFR